MNQYRPLLLIVGLLASCTFDPGGLSAGDAAGTIVDAAPGGDVTMGPGVPDARPEPDAPPPPAENCENGGDDDGDGLTDCKDPDCGSGICDDGNPCTADHCLEGGSCVSTPEDDDDSTCGDGCACQNGEPTETDCFDGNDNDADGTLDCGDGDCGGCFITDTCCGDGVCRLICF